MIAKRILQTGTVQVLSLFLGVVAGIFITRLLGPEGRGVYAIFKANVDFLLLFVGFGMGSVITYYVSNRKIPVSKILGLSVLGAITGTIIVGLILILLPATGLQEIALPKNFDSVWFKAYLVLSFAVGIGGVIFTGFLNGRNHFNQTNLVALVNALVLLIAVVFVFTYASGGRVFDDTVSVLTVTFVTAAVNLVMLGFFFLRKYRDELQISFDISNEVKVAAGFIYLVYLGELINFFNYRLDIWLVQYFESSYQLGLYTLAVSVSQMLWLVAAPVTIVLLPHLNNPDNREESNRLFFFMRESHLA